MVCTVNVAHQIMPLFLEISKFPCHAVW